MRRRELNQWNRVWSSWEDLPAIVQWSAVWAFLHSGPETLQDQIWLREAFAYGDRGPCALVHQLMPAWMSRTLARVLPKLAPEGNLSAGKVDAAAGYFLGMAPSTVRDARLGASTRSASFHRWAEDAKGLGDFGDPDWLTQPPELSHLLTWLAHEPLKHGLAWGNWIPVDPGRWFIRPVLSLMRHKWNILYHTGRPAIGTLEHDETSRITTTCNRPAPPGNSLIRWSGRLAELSCSAEELHKMISHGPTLENWGDHERTSNLEEPVA